MKSYSKMLCCGLALLMILCLAGFSLQTQAEEKEKDELYTESYLMPPKDIQDLLTRDKNFDTLTNLSPDREHFLIPISGEYSSLKLMTQRTLRLGMLEICPDVNREWRLSTYGNIGLKIFSLKQKDDWLVKLSKDVFVSEAVWSPDGKKLAFLAHLPQGTQVWTADVASGKVDVLSKAYVMATLTGRRRYGRSPAGSRMLQWTPSGSIVTLLVPDDRGPEPKESAVPSSPLIRHTRKKATPTSTYPFLLRTAYDQALFRYYTTAQLAELAPGKSPRKIGEPAMYQSISLSPDGKYVLAEKVVEPFSYIVSYSSFPRDLEVMDMSGKVLSTIRKIPLREASGGGRNAQADLPRDVAWRPDGKGLSFLWREQKEKKKDDEEEEGENEDRDERKDRLMLLPAPFDMDLVQTLIVSKKRFGNVSYAVDGEYVFSRLSGEGEDCETGTDIVAFDLKQTPPKKNVLLKDIETEDLVKLPGDLMTSASSNGISYALTSNNNTHVYLQAAGYKEDLKRRPFIDQLAVSDGKLTRIFESSADMYENPLVPLDRDLNSMVISRESRTTFPDSWLWEKDNTVTKLTNNRDPYPEFAKSKRVDYTYKRRDGLEIHGRISLPPDYQEGTRVPGVFWTYPREFSSFKDYKKAAIRSQNLNAFLRFSTRNASDIWLSQGYAVVVPDIPIIGKGNTFNNNYVAHLVDSMYAAIRKMDELGYVDVDRLGHGGHSYGAFATANILARSPFFKAGIAGDGAYNRTLTPMSFQSERRFIWEAQDVYLEMSPFFNADHIDTPLLMYHGAVDNNTGTFLIQSERFIQALTGLGKNAVLYIYPFESHGPRCLETYMDMWVRWLGFFDKYVKNGEK